MSGVAGTSALHRVVSPYGRLSSFPKDAYAEPVATATSVLRDVLKVDNPKLAPGAALRAAVGMAICLVAGQGSTNRAVSDGSATQAQLS